MKEYRRGYEFSSYTKQLTRQLSGGLCMDAMGCTLPHNNTVDHKVSIRVSQEMGVDKQFVRAPSNAQMLCHWHDRYKTKQEARFLDALDRVKRRQVS